MRRREFMVLLSVAALAGPRGVVAQQPEQMRNIGMLMTLTADDTRAQGFVAAFLDTLQNLGWARGRSARVEIRWAGGDAKEIRRHASELAALVPDVILATGAVSAGPLLEASRSVPIVFVIVPDPIGAGFVASLAHPGGNATGFLMFEYAIGAKWLELLKEMAPSTTRVAVIRDPANPAGTGQWGAIQSVAPSFGVELAPVNVRDASEIEHAVGDFARKPNGGLIVTASALAALHRHLIIALASRYKLPTVYYDPNFAVAGGLFSYGPDFADQFRAAAGYVDRILRGEKAADLPVQAPSKYALTINLKTAKAIGLAVPPSLLARADEVIE